MLAMLKERENNATSRKRIVWKNNQPTLIEHFGTGEDITHKNSGNLYMGAVWPVNSQGELLYRVPAPWEKLMERERLKAFTTDDLPVMSYPSSRPLPAAEYYGEELTPDELLAEELEWVVESPEDEDEEELSIIVYEG